MRMDRNQNPDGCGKYAVVNLRRLNALCGVGEPSRRWPPDIVAAMRTLEKAGVLEWGAVGQPDEFFLVKLKDKHAQAALGAYAWSVSADDPEFGREVAALASRSGPGHPLCKAPD